MANDLPGTLMKALAVYAGDHYALPMAFSTGGVPNNLTGLTLSADWRPNRGSDTVVPLQIQVTNAAAGAFTFIVSGAASRQMVEGADKDAVLGVWDIQVSNGTTVTTYLKGTMVTTKDVTRG